MTDQPRSRLRGAGLLMLGAMLALATSRAHADPMYTVTNLGDLQVRGPSSLNDAGEVVGNQNFGWYGTPVLYQSYGPAGGTFTDLTGVLGGNASLAGINDSGQIVGTLFVNTASTPNTTRAILDSGGQVTVIQPMPGTPDTTAVGISDSGAVLGASGYHGYIYQNGQMTDLGQTQPVAISAAGVIAANASGGSIYQNGQVTSSLPSGTWLSAVNDSGQAVGTYVQGAGSKNETVYGFVYQNGHLTYLQLPNGSFDEAYGINPQAVNSQGQVVGYYLGPAGSIRAFLDRDGKLVDLNSLIPASSGWTLISPVSINAKGQILGYGGGPDGHRDTFLLTPTSMTPPTPTPEPSMLAIFALAAAGAASRRAWRRRS